MLEHQVPWVAWAEMTEVPVASNLTYFNVLGNPSTPFLPRNRNFCLDGPYFQSNHLKASMLVSSCVSLAGYVLPASSYIPLTLFLLSPTYVCGFL